MNTRSVVDWVQILTGVAVVVGLGLVIWELQQAREIARFEQLNTSFAQYTQRIQTHMGENAASAVAKACDHPDDLTTEEMFVLDRYYTNVLNNVREPLLAGRLSEDLNAIPWERWAPGNFSIVFATEYGRWWFENSSWEPEIMEAGRKFLASREPPNCAARYDGYRNRPK
jgi:hypothetical protein